MTTRTDRARVDMSPTDAAILMKRAGLRADRPVRWGTPIPCDRPGVYVIEAPTRLAHAPLDRAVIAAWIRRVPSLRLDGRRPSADELAERLASFWFPDDAVVYVGLAGTSVARRVRQFYRTPLGDPRPHAGGHWLKTFSNLDDLRVWWAQADDPGTAEDRLLTAFARRHGKELLLPFANRQTARGVRKAHGITGSTLPGPSHGPRSSRRERLSATTSRIKEINEALQRLACAEPAGEVRAVDAARALERLGLLRDSLSRPGKALRDLLRAGHIEHAYQEGGRWWFIRCRRS